MRRRQRVFKQERAKQTYAAILRASAKLFARRGFDRTQVPDIARAAGVSIGAVYRYFTDKREIFLEMIDDELGAAREEVERRLARLDAAEPRAAIEAVLEVFFARANKDRSLTRVYLAMSLSDRDVAALRARAEAADREVLAALIAAAAPRGRVRDPMAAAFVVQTAAIAVAAECALDPRTDEAAAKAELATMIERYFVGD